MSIVPYRFLLHTSHAIPYVKGMPVDDGIPDLPDKARLENFADVDAQTNFADVRFAWNELGLAVSLKVSGKSNFPIGDRERPRQSDGITIWIDTRGDRSSHRATRTCHQFHLLAAGDGSNKDEPCIVQTKINRALQDAPMVSISDVLFHCERTKKGYIIEAFFHAGMLNGFDPEQFPQLGLFYSVRDFELGEQTLSIPGEFPFWEDPSLWETMVLSKDK